MWLTLKIYYLHRTLITAASEASGWPKRCKLARAFLWENSYERLKLGQVFLTSPPPDKNVLRGEQRQQVAEEGPHVLAIVVFFETSSGFQQVLPGHSAMSPSSG